MDLLSDLAVDGLAAARITRLVVEDRIADAPRGYLSGLHPTLDYWLGCPWCVGIWVAFGVAVVRPSRLWRSVRYPLAVAQVTGILNELA